MRPSKITACLSLCLLLYLVIFAIQVYINDFDGGTSTSLNRSHWVVHSDPDAKNSALILPFQGSKALTMLMKEVLKVDRPIPDDISNSNEIDPSIETELCKKFKLLSYNGRTKRRRIFAGGLIADDSWHVIGANALESYGVFHSVTLIESNRTQSFEPRPLRFTPGSNDLKILQSGIYGPHTSVHLENFVHEHEERPLAREHMMRDAILLKWKELGMTRDDIGLILDMDEVPSRQILRASQMCDLPDDNWSTSSEKQTCRSPKLMLSFPMFEGSPKCVHKGKKLTFGRFISTSMVIGACIEGIGDSIKHPSIPRERTDMHGKPQGPRLEGYGLRHNYSKIPHGDNGYFPLYNSADFRQMISSNSIFGGAGVHLHNFFDSAEAIRFKYAYYGHIHKHAYSVPLGGMNADMNLFIKCAHNISDEGNRKQRLENGLDLFTESFPLPAAFELEGYIDARHEEMVALIEKDEEEYGRADKFDGHHLYNENMLTHAGRKHKEENKSKIKN